MRRLQPKPKDRCKVAILVELRIALREVHEFIQQANRDSDINLDYGDAIQVDRVCGGRNDKNPKHYDLTFYPKGDAERGKWFLTLDHTEIEDIGDGCLQELPMYCCTSTECSSKFSDVDDTCFYCDYIDDPNFGSFSFPEAEMKLSQRGINGLSENSSKEVVIGMMGTPDKFGGGKKEPLIGYIWPWVKYIRSDCQLYFEFNKDCKRLRKISVLEKE